jgi:hypothetical protein
MPSDAQASSKRQPSAVPTTPDSSSATKPLPSWNAKRQSSTRCGHLTASDSRCAALRSVSAKGDR